MLPLIASFSRMLARGPLGAHVSSTGTTFRLWSTAHACCEVRLYDEDGTITETIPLVATGGGYHERVVHVGHGTRYRFVLDDMERNDPYTRFLPKGIAEPGMVYQSHYQWRYARVTRPLREHVIYELHVGAFTDEGTYA